MARQAMPELTGPGAAPEAPATAAEAPAAAAFRVLPPVRAHGADHVLDVLQQRIGDVRLTPERDEQVDLLIRTVVCETVSLHMVRYGAAAALRAERDDMLHINLPVAGVVRIANHPRVLEAAPGSGFIASPDFDAGNALLVRKRSDVQDMLLRIPMDLVRGVAGADTVAFEPLIDRGAAGVRSWLRLVGVLQQEAQADATVLRNPLAASSLVQLLVSSLLAAQPNSSMAQVPERVLPHRVQVVVDAIRDEPGRAWRIPELAALAHCSARSLQIAFREELGQGPLAYLRTARLDGARRALRAAAEGEVTVSEVADAWGFGHLGRFTTAYREAFGELPSTTLRDS